VRFHIPIKLPSLSNCRMHWRRMASLKKQQRLATRVCLICAMSDHQLPEPPLLVTITRVGPQRLDDDNLSGACKYVRDQIATAVGIDDGSELYTWKYEQRIGAYGVDVEITSM
jgi:hypothetical protein